MRKDDPPAEGAPEEIKIIAGFQSKAVAPPISACNQIVGQEGELAYNLSNVRNTTHAYLSMNMWTVSIFGNKNLKKLKKDLKKKKLF